MDAEFCSRCSGLLEVYTRCGRRDSTLCRDCGRREQWCAGCQACEFRGGHRIAPADRRAGRAGG